MSLEFQAKIICDGCGEVRTSDIEHRSTRAKEVLWDLDYQLKKEGWVTVSRSRFLTRTHFCPQCVDKPMKPVPRKTRTKT